MSQFTDDQLSALQDELKGASYATLSHEECAERINAATLPVAVDVSIKDLEGYLRRKGLVYKMTVFMELAKDAPEEIRGVVFELVNMIQSPRLTVIEMSDPGIAEDMTRMLGTLGPEGAGLLSQEDLTAILAMGQSTVPMWSKFLHRPLDWGDISAARGK